MNTGTEVAFQSPFFKPIPGEDEETNPGCYGKALANWLVQKLKERNFPVEDAIPEDYGWCITLRYPLFKSNHPPAKPGAFVCEPLKAAGLERIRAPGLCAT